MAPSENAATSTTAEIHANAAPDQDASTESTFEPIARASGERIKIPLQAVAKTLPKEFFKRGAQGVSVRGYYFLSKDDALEQLSTGAVKVSFREIREAAGSNGVFVENSAKDDELVALPLKEVLKRIGTDSFDIRGGQSRLSVPESIGDIFGPKGEALSEIRILKKEDLRTSGSGAGAAAESTSPANSTPAPTVPRPVAETLGTAAPASAPASVAQPPSSIPPSDALRQFLQQNAHGQAQPSRPIPPPASPARTAPSTRPLPAPAPAPVASSSGGPRQTVDVPLSTLWMTWPESIRKEIALMQMDQSECRLPIVELTQRMRQGRVVFPWQKIRGWLYPPLTSNYASPQDQEPLEVPLDAVIPTFLKSNPTVGGAPAPAPTPAGVQTEIPDIFKPRGFASAPAAPAPARQPATAPLRPAPIQAPPASAPVVSSLASPASIPAGETFRIELATVCGDWPAAISRELERLRLQQATLDIPVSLLEVDLKKGRVEHTWTEIAGWVSGNSGGIDTSQLGGTKLELPLHVLAPAFFKRRPGSIARKAEVPEEIPDIFNAKDKPTRPLAAKEMPPAPVAQAAPAAEEEPSAPVAAAATEPPPAKRKLPSNIAELFGEPRKKNWTPNEIVQKTAELPGVAGAMIALQDGLLVATCMPPEWKSETVAAFLPQMFGRMRQYAKELDVGELRSLTFTVDRGPLQIFNAGLIYFAVLGRTDQQVPLPELAIIADELSRHTK